MTSAILLAALALGQGNPPALDASGNEFFEKKIRPILVERCLSCHGERKQKGDLRLDSKAGVLAGGKAGPAAVPGKPDESPMIEAIGYEGVTKMPPKSKLPSQEIADLTRWVEMGAPWPAEPPRSAVPAARSKVFNLKERAQHWSFQPIRRVEPPTAGDASQMSSPVDRFLLATLEAKGLKPSPEADRRTLIRRLSFDLTGLPPTAAEIDDFVRDPAPDAYEKLVDRLLASPSYGERWARHWLDLVRYAETSGHEFDYDIPDAWRYRDYVVRALNLDLPYDRFVTEQVAGDLLPSPRRNPVDGSNESILGTGFFFLGEGTHSPVDVREDEIMRVDNQIDVLSKTFLGLTVSCARCHDHKFDAITTKDYYALTGFLRSSRFDHAAIDDPERIKPKLDELKAIRAELARQLASPEAARQAIAYLSAAREIRAGKEASTSGDDPSDILFEDFESSSYRDWKATGTAFGDGPIRLPLPSYQGEVEARGRGLVGSHNGRIDGTVTDRDNLTGTLTSPEFPIDRDYIHFLIGGGSHPGRTCVNLIVDGSKVSSTTGRDQNRMRPHVLDVKAYRGKTARLEVVDRQQGAWGNISLDHVVFSDQPSPPGDPRRCVASLAKRRGLDPETLARCVESLPKLAIAIPDARDRAGVIVFEDFNQPTFGSWKAAGEAFGDAPSRAGSLRIGEGGASPVKPGWAHSGLISDRLQGTLRSPTFVIQQKYIHTLAQGHQGQVRVIVDGFEKVRDPIYGGLVSDVQTDSPRWHTQDVSMWAGQKAYIEVADGAILEYRSGLTSYAPGDGYIAVDEVVFSDRPQPPEMRSEGMEPEAGEISALFDAWRSGKSSESPRVAQAVVLMALMVDAGAIGKSGAIAGWLDRYRKVEGTLPLPTLANTICDGTGEDQYVLIRGNAKMPGEPAPRRFLEAIAGPDQAPIASGSGRLELARRILDPSCPAPPRVMVNRLWKHHFGTGLVSTPDDFGEMGEAPSHPELLDWLASEFVAKGWSLKAMHRLMVTSRAYRMDSRIDPKAEAVDPANRLLHRMSVRRLEAEAIRDAMLRVSGRLDPKMGGPGVPPYLTPFMEGRGRPAASGPIDGDGRRSLYLSIRRNFLSPMLMAFDFPAPASTMGRRNVSNVPAQALTLFNDPFILGQARLWAEHLLKQPNLSTHERLNQAYEAAFARPPDATEVREAEQFLAARTPDAGELAAWGELCHVLFNVKEFLFVP